MYDDTVVNTNTAVVLTLNDLSKPTSSLVTLFGDPNDYVGLADRNAYSHAEVLPAAKYDHFHAVTVDIHTRRIYYGNNALGIIAHSSIFNNVTNYLYYPEIPTNKQVNLLVVSLTWYLIPCYLTTSTRLGSSKGGCFRLGKSVVPRGSVVRPLLFMIYRAQCLDIKSGLDPVAASAQQRSQVISRSEHPRAMSPGCTHCQHETNKAVSGQIW